MGDTIFFLSVQYDTNFNAVDTIPSLYDTHSDGCKIHQTFGFMLLCLMETLVTLLPYFSARTIPGMQRYLFVKLTECVALSVPCSDACLHSVTGSKSCLLHGLGRRAHALVLVVSRSARVPVSESNRRIPISSPRAANVWPRDYPISHSATVEQLQCGGPETRLVPQTGHVTFLAKRQNS